MNKRYNIPRERQKEMLRNRPIETKNKVDLKLLDSWKMSLPKVIRTTQNLEELLVQVKVAMGLGPRLGQKVNLPQFKLRISQIRESLSLYQSFPWGTAVSITFPLHDDKPAWTQGLVFCNKDNHLGPWPESKLLTHLVSNIPLISPSNYQQLRNQEWDFNHLAVSWPQIKRELAQHRHHPPYWIISHSYSRVYQFFKES